VDRILPLQIEMVREELLREAENAAFAVPVVCGDKMGDRTEKTEEKQSLSATIEEEKEK
jgi:hypothetical protein